MSSTSGTRNLSNSLSSPGEDGGALIGDSVMDYLSLRVLKAQYNLALQRVEAVGRTQTLKLCVGLGQCAKPSDVIDQNRHGTLSYPTYALCQNLHTL